MQLGEDLDCMHIFIFIDYYLYFTVIHHSTFPTSFLLLLPSKVKVQVISMTTAETMDIQTLSSYQ